MMSPEIAAALGGGAVGFALSLTGGGGSIPAVPILLYGVGLPSPHIAIGTASVAVAGNALVNVLLHARSKLVKWPCGLLFAVSGIVGAYAGAHLALQVDGGKLLLAFAGVMALVAGLMLRRRADRGDPAVTLNRAIGLRLVPAGLATGAASGFFGIGGGFLIVPGLMFSAAMPIRNAAATSLLAVAAFGTTTAVSYALAHLVDWTAAAVFIAGGVGGGMLGMAVSRRLARHQSALTAGFAVLILVAAAYVAFRALSS